MKVRRCADPQCYNERKWIRAERDGAREEVKHERRLWDSLNDQYHEQRAKHKQQMEIALSTIFALKEQGD